MSIIIAFADSIGMCADSPLNPAAVYVCYCMFVSMLANMFVDYCSLVSMSLGVWSILALIHCHVKRYLCYCLLISMLACVCVCVHYCSLVNMRAGVRVFVLTRAC